MRRSRTPISALLLILLAPIVAACAQAPALVATQDPNPTPITTPAPTPTGVVQAVSPTPQTTPSASPTEKAIDLTGLWDDNGRQVLISQSGSSVTGTYVETYVCDHQDGTGQTSETDIDFTAILDGRTLSGEINTCSFGSENPLGVGIKPAPFTVTLSDDNRELTGTWYLASWMRQTFR